MENNKNSNEAYLFSQSTTIKKRQLISRWQGLKWGLELARFDGDPDKCPPMNNALIGNSITEFALGAATGMELFLAEKFRREGDEIVCEGKIK